MDYMILGNLSPLQKNTYMYFYQLFSYNALHPAHKEIYFKLCKNNIHFTKLFSTLDSFSFTSPSLPAQVAISTLSTTILWLAQLSKIFYRTMVLNKEECQWLWRVFCLLSLLSFVFCFIYNLNIYLSYIEQKYNKYDIRLGDYVLYFKLFNTELKSLHY